MANTMFMSLKYENENNNKNTYSVGLVFCVFQCLRIQTVLVLTLFAQRFAADFNLSLHLNRTQSVYELMR